MGTDRNLDGLRNRGERLERPMSKGTIQQQPGDTVVLPDYGIIKKSKKNV